MRHWKQQFVLLMTAVLCISILAGCSGQNTEFALSVCVGGEPEELDPIYAVEPEDQTILTHLYENLMRLSVDVSGENTVVYGAAKSTEQEENSDGTVTWTFQLRSARWSDGQRVTAGDFVYAWQRLADPANASPNTALLSIVAGYDAVQETGDVTQLQVSAEDDSTLVVVLNGKYDWFLTEVCTATATMPLRQDLLQEDSVDGEAPQAEPEESEETDALEGADWWTDLEALVTNGPYQVQTYTAGDSLVLKTNERYHSDGEGPTNLTFRFADTAEEAQALYDVGTVDFIGTIPEDQLASLVEEESRNLIPELGVYSVLFNCQQELLSDQVIRQALGMVIDRNAVAEAAGIAAQPAEGLIPPGVPESEDTDFRTAWGPQLDNETEHYEERCQEAKRLLAEAGYEDGWGLEEWEYLYVESDRNAAVARVLTQTWLDTLNIRITARGVSQEELEAALKEGTYALAGVEIRPVGNDAECYLMQWGSNHPLNFSGYANSAYDTLLSVIAGAEDETARMGCLHDAESLLLEDCAVSPLYTDRTAWALRDNLTGVCRDPRGWFDFTAVAPGNS